MEYAVLIASFIVLYIIASFVNPIARKAIQQVALVKYTKNGESYYVLLHSDKRILKELIYTKNLNHLEMPVSNFDAIYFFNKSYKLKTFDGVRVTFAKDHIKEEIIETLKVNYLNVYNKYSMSRFVSFVRGDYESAPN